MRALFLVAGHGKSSSGRSDPGAVLSGTTERKEVVEITNEVHRALFNDPAITGTGLAIYNIGSHEELSLSQKIETINRICSDNGYTESDSLVISFHLNSASSKTARGIESWYSKKKDSRKEAVIITEAVSNWTKMPLRRYPTRPSSSNRHGRLAIIDDTIPKAFLIECGFLSNEQDAAIVKDDVLDDGYASGVLNGMKELLNLPVNVRIEEEFYIDVREEQWFFDAVKTCLLEGLLELPDDKRFNPGKPMTRGEVAIMFARHLKKHHDSSTANNAP